MINLGIDIDGCLNNFQDALAIILKRDFNVEVPRDEYEMLRDIKLENMEQCKAFWDKYNPELYKLLSCEPYACDVLRKFKKMGLNLNVVTAREYHVAGLTEKWLNTHYVTYDNIFMNAYDKAAVCKWKDIPLIIEDKPSNVLSMAENGIKVLMYTRPYNLNVKHPNVIPVTNWLEVFDEVTKFIRK
jgi:uncharacterized HAD superfamily protein